MSDEVKKDEVKEEVKLENIYAGSPYTPPYCPPDMGPGPVHPPEHMDSLADRLKCLMGQQVTIYTDDLVVSGTLHRVGEDYIEVHVLSDNVQRTVYVPLYSVLAIVPGGPLLAQQVEVTQTATTPGLL